MSACSGAMSTDIGWLFASIGPLQADIRPPSVCTGLVPTELKPGQLAWGRCRRAGSHSRFAAVPSSVRQLSATWQGSAVGLRADPVAPLRDGGGFPRSPVSFPAEKLSFRRCPIGRGLPAPCHSRNPTLKLFSALKLGRRPSAAAPVSLDQRVLTGCSRSSCWCGSRRRSRTAGR
jgi:hypothetical protein